MSQIGSKREGPTFCQPTLAQASDKWLYIDWMDIHNYPVHNFKPYFVTPLLLGGFKFGQRALVGMSPICLQKEEASKTNKERLLLWFYEFSSTSTSPTGYTKEFNSVSKQQVTKNWYIIQIYPSSIYLLFW